MYRRYKSKGKKTIYGPGTATAYICFAALMVWGIMLLQERTLAGMDWFQGIGLLVALLIILIVIPERSLGSMDSPYDFKSAGYFEKFL